MEIIAEVRTNLDHPNLPHAAKHWQAVFPAMPCVGHTFLWLGHRTKIVSVGWISASSNNSPDKCYLTVEINK